LPSNPSHNLEKPERCRLHFCYAQPYRGTLRGSQLWLVPCGFVGLRRARRLQPRRKESSSMSLVVLFTKEPRTILRLSLLQTKAMDRTIGRLRGSLLLPSFLSLAPRSLPVVQPTLSWTASWVSPWSCTVTLALTRSWWTTYTHASSPSSARLSRGF